MLMNFTKPVTKERSISTASRLNISGNKRGELKRQPTCFYWWSALHLTTEFGKTIAGYTPYARNSKNCQDVGNPSGKSFLISVSSEQDISSSEKCGSDLVVSSSICRVLIQPLINFASINLLPLQIVGHFNTLIHIFTVLIFKENYTCQERMK